MWYSHPAAGPPQEMTAGREMVGDAQAAVWPSSV